MGRTQVERADAAARNGVHAPRRPEPRGPDPVPAAIPTAGPAARLVSRTLAEIEAKPVEWLWPGRIPRGMLTMLDGDPAHGKTLITLDIAARLSRAEPMPGCSEPACGPSGVLIIAAEDAVEQVIKPRAIAAGADERLIPQR